MIGTWIAAVIVGILFLMSVAPQFSEEFRSTSRGREFRLITLTLGIVLAILVWSLVKGPLPAAAP